MKIEQDQRDRINTAVSTMGQDIAKIMTMIDKDEFERAAIYSEAVANLFNGFSTALKKLIVEDITNE